MSDQPSGTFPRGKLCPADEGQIQMEVGTSNGAVIIRFGKPIKWLGLGAEEADGLADLLKKHASALRAPQG